MRPGVAAFSTHQDPEPTVPKLFDRVTSGAPDTELAEFFNGNVDWYIPGNTAETPDGTPCVVLGELLTRLNATGKRISTAFAVDIRSEDGLITRYDVFEDTYAAAAACRG